MKKTTLNFVIGLFIILPNFFYSQWGVIPGGDGRTAPGIRSIGIGNFTILDRPKADLNISDFYLPGSTNFLPGSLFRADGNSNVDNNWQLFTGTAANALTEKFRISVLAPTAPLNTPNDVSISTVQDGRMLFSTNGFNRMFIDNGLGIGNPGLGGGRIAIGNNLPAGFIPQSRVHIHQAGGNPAPGNNTYIRFTNNVTGVLATDGFAIGNTSALFNSGTVQLQQYEQAPVSIFLPNGGGVLTNYFHILNGTGFTGINTNAPTRQFDVNGKVRVQNLISNGANAGLVTHFADGTLQNLLFTGNPAQVLLGNGTWGPIPPGGGGVSFCAPLPNNNVVKATLVANQVCGTNIFDLPGGLVGINTPAPNDALDVQNGNIDVVTPTNSYRISNSDFLWHKGAITCLYAGVGAGNGQNAASLNNIFMGFNAGFNSTNLANNVTNIGYESGFNDQGAGSVFIGRRAGFSNVPGDFNTFVGSNAGEFNVAGAVNAYMGFRSGQNNNGNSNVMIGVNSGQTITNGDNNVLLGGQTNSTKVNLINGVALGFNSIVRNDDQMILGNNNINVGIGLSNDINGPQNKLEINTPAATPIPGASGLRFRDLTSASNILPNPGTGVLTVDNNGDVILTSGSVSGALGGICGSNTNPLATNYEIPLNNQNFIFGGQGLVNNNVGIGTNCTPQAKLHVTQSSGLTNGSIGILVENTDDAACLSTNPVIGIKSIMSAPVSISEPKIAGWFEAPFAPNCIGSLQHYALYVPQNGGYVDIGYSPPSANFASLVNINGSLNSANYVGPSDVSLKNTIVNLPNALQQIKSLRPVTYKWNNSFDSIMSGTHAGFIAQEVDTVIPQLVHTNPNNLKSLAYIEMIPYLVKAIQQQQRMIEKQDSLITVLTQNIASCCSNSNVRTTGIYGNNINKLNIELTDKDVIVLNQNVPNPFAESTVITYNIPVDFKIAQIIFNTTDGRIIKAVDIKEKGKGELNVYANDLTNGLYSYYLVIDGKVIDTKKLVKQN